MKSYIEIKVPIRYEESWFEQLRDLLDDVDIRWQRGYHHITMAFLDYAPDGVNIVPGLNDILKNATAPVITFDKLDTFASGYHRHVIHLTTSEAPEDFIELVDNLRQYFLTNGCRMQSDFKLHVTLGRVQDPRMNVHKLKDIIGQVDLPRFTMQLTCVEYRVFRGKTLGLWKLVK